MGAEHLVGGMTEKLCARCVPVSDVPLDIDSHYAEIGGAASKELEQCGGLEPVRAVFTVVAVFGGCRLSHFFFEAPMALVPVEQDCEFCMAAAPTPRTLPTAPAYSYA
jgi:hypothetical protein